MDDRIGKIRGYVLRTQPFYTVEQAYAFVRRKDNGQVVILKGTEITIIVIMASKGIKKRDLNNLLYCSWPNVVSYHRMVKVKCIYKD